MYMYVYKHVHRLSVVIFLIEDTSPSTDTSIINERYDNT